MQGMDEDEFHPCLAEFLNREVVVTKKTRVGYYVAIVVVFVIAVFTLGLEGYLMAPVWGWRAMLVWVPLTALAFWGSWVATSFLVGAMNKWVIPHIIRLLEK